MTAERTLQTAKRLLSWRGRGLSFLAALALWLALPHAAFAQSPATILGMSSRSIGLGGAVSASVADFSSVYYNPAGLANRTDLQLSVGPNLVIPNFWYSNFAGKFSGVTDPYLMNQFGAVVPIGGPLKKKVAVGVGMMTPFPTLTSIRIRTPEEPSFVFTEDLLQTPMIAFGLGFRPNKYLTLGAGGQLLIQAEGTVRTAFDLANARITQRDTALTINPVIAPIIGFQIVPIRYVRIGGFWRFEVKPSVSLPFSADTGIVGFTSNFVSNVLYSPPQLGGGVSFEFLDKFVVSFDGVFVQSSKTPSPGVHVRVTPDALFAPIVTVDPNPGFSDTFQLHGGLEYKYNEDIRFRTGYFRRVTPVPEQAYDTSFLDESINAISIGAGITLKDPTEILEKPFTMDMHVQYQFMDSGRARRASALQPVGDLKFGGSIIAIGFNGTVRF